MRLWERAGVGGKSKWGLSCKKIAFSFLWSSEPCDFQKGRVLSYAGKLDQLVCFQWLTFDLDLSSILLTKAGLLSFKKFSGYHAAN